MTLLLLKRAFRARYNNNVKQCCIVMPLVFDAKFGNYNLCTKYVSADSVIADQEFKNTESAAFTEVLKYCKDHRILYSCVIEKYKLNVPRYMQKKIRNEIEANKKQKLYNSSIPLIVEKFRNLKSATEGLVKNDAKDTKQFPVIIDHASNQDQFPFARFEDVKLEELPKYKPDTDEESVESLTLNQPSIKEDVAIRLQAYNEKLQKGVKFSQTTEHEDKDLEVRIYEDTLLSDLEPESSVERIPDFYGTSKPDVPKSSVPCGGCGSFLHCQDEGLPGYTPSEVFCNKNKAQLRAVLCQRCLFLQKHQAALNVRVSPSVYEKALQPIAQSFSLILVVVDLLDTPCSVWPGLFDLIGPKRPVIVVGNKVDLLPLDNINYLVTIRESLVSALKLTNLWMTNIQHICLTSAKTGYGVESLISQIQVKWGVKGDIYIVGCTNVGKSTLFNALLGSDLCKVAASSLIRRATASPWPGTTLNLLKFPLLRPSGKLLFDRSRRLLEDKKERELEAQNKTDDRKFTLQGRVKKTFFNLVGVRDVFDPFGVTAGRISQSRVPSIGINDASKEYSKSKWCYDTPGTVQPEQFLGLLSHDELLDVLPSKAITPRMFALYNSQSVLVAGVARLDLLYCPLGRIRVTVCCSSDLPITIVNTCEAANLSRSYLGTDLLRVPRGSEERLRRWPALRPTNLRLRGRGKETAGDVVLSSAGFISVTGDSENDIELRGWTPGGRGVHVRAISMLPHSENMKGKKKRDSQKYHLKDVLVN